MPFVRIFQVMLNVERATLIVYHRYQLVAVHSSTASLSSKDTPPFSSLVLTPVYTNMYAYFEHCTISSYIQLHVVRVGAKYCMLK